MTDFAPKDIRTFALVGHQGSGKTTIAEAMLYLAGVHHTLGSVAAKTSVLDYEPEEQDRGGSVAAHLLTIEFDKRRLHVFDTPGDGSFIHEGRSLLAGVDAVICVISAVDGVEVETERMFRTAGDLGLPRVVFVNKMDRERADHEAVLADIEESLGVKPVPLQLPIGKEHHFKGVVDLLRHEARIFHDDKSGKYDSGPIPAELAGEVARLTERLTEAAAEADEHLLEKYLETLELTNEELFHGLEEGVRSGKVVPVMYGNANENHGVWRLLEVTAAMPSPVDRPPRLDADGDKLAPDASGSLILQVLKTIIDPYTGTISLTRVIRGTLTAETEVRNANRNTFERIGSLYWAVGKKLSDCAKAGPGDIVALTKLKGTHTGDTLCAVKGEQVVMPHLDFRPPMATFIVKPETRKDEDKMRESLQKIAEEDPALVIGQDGLTKETTVAGQSVAHIEMGLKKLSRKYKVSLTTEIPPVPYRETIKGSAEIEGKHKKQTGGRGQFAVAWMRIKPLPRGTGFQFVDEIKGGAIPRNYLPAIEKGIHGAMDRGVLAGYPIQDVQVTVFDGKYHAVDSSEAAFMMAGSKGFKAGFLQCHPTILEPIVKMVIVCPEDAVGDVMGDIGSRRGRLQNTEYRGSRAVVHALVPLAEVQTYGADLRAMTQGKGSFTMELNGYEELPSNLQEKVIAAGRGEQIEEEDED